MSPRYRYSRRTVPAAPVSLISFPEVSYTNTVSPLVLVFLTRWPKRIATAGTRSFVFDPNGSTTADGLNTYAYDTRGRMVQAVSAAGTTSYQVNALGQRIRKTNSSADTVFIYDTSGRLVAESDPNGVVERELIYLGDVPVGVVQ